MISSPSSRASRLLAAVRLDDADHDIVAVLFPGARLLQHFVGLADARGGADENLEPAGSALFAPGGLEQGFRRGSLVRIAPLIHHQESDISRHAGMSPSSLRQFGQRHAAQGETGR